MPDREPANFWYCLEVNCQYRHGNKCSEGKCVRIGNEKRQAYYTKTGNLAEGDVPE